MDDLDNSFPRLLKVEIIMITAVASILVAVLTAVSWITTLRHVDRISLFLKITAKIGIRRLLLRRPGLHQLRLCNGLTLRMPRTFLKYSIDEVLKLRMRLDDVIVASYPKSGTTWMQEIVWLICNGGDTEKADTESLYDRYGYVEAMEHQGMGNGLQSMEQWPRNKRRFIKTHLPFELLPNELQKKPFGKMIYVARNPKDCCVSYYHFHRMNVAGLPEPGTWNEFLTKFCKGDVTYDSWFDHVKTYWQVHQNRMDSIYFTTYETLKHDLKGEVRKLAKFLEKDLCEAQLDAIVQHSTFRSMSERKGTSHSEGNRDGVMNFKVSKFMRKGQVGDWKNYFTINQNIEFDLMYQERAKEWDLKFEFEPRD